MKKTILTLTTTFALTGAMWLSAQQSDEGSTGTTSDSDESKTAMVEKCRHICATQYDQESPASLLAWKQELNLREDQVASLQNVEEKAISDAKALLTAEQLGKLQELAQSTKPQPMMHGMQGTEAKMEHGMPMCCAAMQATAEH
jgi:hypothetical protein